MHRKDYNVIVAALRDAARRLDDIRAHNVPSGRKSIPFDNNRFGVQIVVEAMIDALKHDNPLFDEDKFIAALES